MFTQILMSIVSYAVPAVSVTMLSWIVYAIKASRKRQGALEEGVKCLLREQIIQAHRYHVVQGHEISSEEYNSGKDMIASYLTLKGSNGYIEHIAKEYEDAPISGQH